MLHDLFFKLLSVAYAAGPALSVPIPGQTIDTSNPVSYLNAIYLYVVGISGVFALLVLVYSGVTYILAAGNPAQQEASRHRITRTIFGLLLLFSVVLILNVIDPDLKKISLINIKGVEGVKKLTLGEKLDEAFARAKNGAQATIDALATTNAERRARGEEEISPDGVRTRTAVNFAANYNDVVSAIRGKTFVDVVAAWKQYFDELGSPEVVAIWRKNFGDDQSKNDVFVDTYRNLHNNKDRAQFFVNMAASSDPTAQTTFIQQLSAPEAQTLFESSENVFNFAADAYDKVSINPINGRRDVSGAMSDAQIAAIYRQYSADKNYLKRDLLFGVLYTRHPAIRAEIAKTIGGSAPILADFDQQTRR